ncbi:unnamed protein product [Nesidiocoris tenuis]|uniref:Uncharacterized protein n=1 Tax=Nesidiocoris tenuis TaxID=355587 RepID=A0A6H5HTN4_9HEMI|nr:unnamed protein product [Nesidiocoris tenuis]
MRMRRRRRSRRRRRMTGTTMPRRRRRTTRRRSRRRTTRRRRRWTEMSANRCEIDTKMENGSSAIGLPQWRKTYLSLQIKNSRQSGYFFEKIGLFEKSSKYSWTKREEHFYWRKRSKNIFTGKT